MIKYILGPFITFFLLLTLPFAGFCQLPFPKWVNDLGGTGDSKPTGMITDKQNNIYVSGYFSGTVDFDPSAGVKNLTSLGGYDIYVAKYTVAGKLIWAESMGGTGLDQVNNMTVDANGNPTITGQYDSPTLKAGSVTLQNSGAEDIFIIHFDTNGGVLWAKSIGGSDTDRGEEVATDIQGDIVATAIFQSTITIGGKILNATGGFNGLIVKYDSSGNLIWYINLGNSGDNEVFGNSVDSNGNIIISGTYTGSVDFDPLGAHHTLNGGFNTPFVAQYTSAGKLVWVNTISGNFVNNGSAVTTGTGNDIYITGAFSSPLLFTSNTTLNVSGSQDTFVAKYSSNGTFQFAKDLGGAGATSFPYQIRSDTTDNVYVTGYFSGTVDFNPNPAATANVTDHGQRDFYVAKLDKNGNYQWAFGGGSPACNLTLGIELAINTSNDVVLAGSFCGSVNFAPATCATDNVTAQNSTSDSFIATYTQATTVNAEITAFTIPQQIYPAIINQTKNTIAVVVAPGSNIKSLIPAITVTNSATVSPASGVAHDFTLPVVYTVTSSCSSLQYSVNVYIAQTDSTCSGAANTIPGDIANPVPSAYAWQLFQNNVWVSAPGVVNNKDYQTSALTNNTNVNVIFGLRRQSTVGGNVTFDSYYQVTVQPAAAITNNAITQPAVTSFCGSGSPGAIVGSTPAGGNGTYAYQWQISADDVAFANIAGATAKDFTPWLTIATTYFRRTITSGTCTAPFTSNVVTITVTPVITNNTVTAPAVTSFCSSGDPGNITGSVPSGGTGGYTYEWQSSTDTVTFTDIAGGAAKDYNPPLTNVTSLYRRIVKSGTCIAISDTVTIVILSPPATPVPVAATIAICTGNSATLSVSSPQSGITYNWYDSASKTNHLFTGATYVTSPLNTNQTFYVDATNGTCVSPGLASVQVNVNSLPAAPPVVASQVAVCDGSVTTLSILSPQTGFTYNWYSAPTGGIAVSSGSDFVTPAITANISYYAEAVNSTGCVSLTRTTVGITANPLPQIKAQGTSICPGASATLTAGSTDQNATINWYASATGGSILFTGGTFTTPVLNAATSYYAEAVDKTTGCTSAARGLSQVQLLQALPAPVVNIDSVNTTSVTFQWSAVNGAIAYQVSADNGQTFVDPSSGSNGLTHTVTGLQLGNSVTLIVRAIGNSSCQTSDNSIPVTGTTISPLGNLIFVPNAFTPNGDGKNDIVYVHSESIRSLKFYVYDQWGELLYASTSQQNGWDGTYKGTKEPVGVYVYYLQAMMNDGHLVTKKGTITLLR